MNPMKLSSAVRDHDEGSWYQFSDQLRYWEGNKSGTRYQKVILSKFKGNSFTCDFNFMMFASPRVPSAPAPWSISLCTRAGIPDRACMWSTVCANKLFSFFSLLLDSGIKHNSELCLLLCPITRINRLREEKVRAKKLIYVAPHGSTIGIAQH